MTEFAKKYDLEERTAEFGESIIELCKTLKCDIVSRPIIDQLVRSGTSDGIQKIYGEAQELTLIFGKIGSKLKI